MAADVFTWSMSEITTRFQELVGNSNLSSTTCHKWINDFLKNEMPEEVNLDLNFDWYTQSTSVDDVGYYSLAQTIFTILEPVTVNNTEIKMYYDRKLFFQDYPEDEQYITAPGLAIGVSDTSAVYNAAFTYEVQGYSYSKASSETSFSGLSTVPQNKYGAFDLRIDTDGTITIDEASGNSDGYDSAGEAVEDLTVADSDSAYMGYVTVISTDSGGFVPGTTALDDSAVTDTYTDGKGQNRDEPTAAIIFDGKLYVRPKADRIYQIKAPDMVRPTELDTGAPSDIKWGPFIAAGAALLYAAEVMKDDELIKRLTKIYDTRKISIKRKYYKQNKHRTAEPGF